MIRGVLCYERGGFWLQFFGSLSGLEGNGFSSFVPLSVTTDSWSTARYILDLISSPHPAGKFLSVLLQVSFEDLAHYVAS